MKNVFAIVNLPAVLLCASSLVTGVDADAWDRVDVTISEEYLPSDVPSGAPSDAPSLVPSDAPSLVPSAAPSSKFILVMFRDSL
jgi:hypothetical protein